MTEASLLRTKTEKQKTDITQTKQLCQDQNVYYLLKT